MNWVDLFGSREYDFPPEVEVGSSFVGGATYPDALVIQSELHYPQRILIQTMDLDVSDETNRREHIRVTRVVAELHGGELVEISRMAQKIEAQDAVDTSVCVGCGVGIVEGQHVIVDGAAYHKRCITENEEERHDRRDRGGADRVRPGLGGDGNREDVTEAAGARVPRTSTPKTVTKGFSDDDISLSHAVTVSRFGAEYDLVTLWAREYGGRSGTVSGRWPNGFHVDDIPKRHEVAYVEEKFFNSGLLVSSADIAIWHRLYIKALEEIGR